MNLPTPAAMQARLKMLAAANRSLWPTANSNDNDNDNGNGDTVILLHGLARSAKAMRTLALQLQQANYHCLNIDYPSTRQPLQTLATQHLHPAILRAQQRQRPIHVVTHSMGGILLRQYLSQHALPQLGRVVMLSPPNHGSEVVDKLANWRPFQWLNGPAGKQLGTDEASIPQQLGPADFELGILTGDRSINWWLSSMISGPDDGKVSVASAKLEGMQAFKVLPVSHPFIMHHPQTLTEVLHFLAHGRFCPC